MSCMQSAKISAHFFLFFGGGGGVIYMVFTLEALDILPLKNFLCSVSNLIFSRLHVSSRCEFLEI